MEFSNPSIKHYLSCVKQELRLCSVPCRQKVLNKLRNDLLSLLDEVPEADFEQVCKQFGRPEVLAREILDCTEPSGLRKHMQHNKRITLTVILGLIVTLSIVIASLVWLLNHDIGHTVEST